MVSVQFLIFGLLLGYFYQAGHFTLTSFFLSLCGLLVFFLILLYHFQGSLLYQPKIYPQYATPQQNPVGYRHPEERDMEYEDVWIRSADGVKLHAWLIRPNDFTLRKQRPTLIFFPANAGNMGFRMENLKVMYSELQLNVLILSYRGYGNSEGTPEEQGIMQDAEATFRWLLAREDIDRDNIFLFGRSLGGAVAIHIAHLFDNEIAGIIVENTFLSISHMVDILFPYLIWIKPYILKISWNSNEKISEISKPMLFLSGLKDEVVPHTHMSSLYELGNMLHKQIVTFAEGMHNNTWQMGGEQYVEAMRRFIEKHKKASSHTPHSTQQFINQ